MTDTTAEAQLYSRLSEVLGVDHAGTLMSYLPREEPATSADLDALRSGIEQRFEGFDQRFEGIDQRMESFHQALLYQGRTYVIATATSIVTTATLVAGIVAFV